MSTGESIEIYKVGHPAGVVNRFQPENGRHMVVIQGWRRNLSLTLVLIPSRPGSTNAWCTTDRSQIQQSPP